jgi:hypothetical protein
VLNLKKILLVVIIGGISGILASGFLLPFLVRANLWGTASFFDKLANRPETVITRVEKETIVIPQSNYFSEAIKKAGPSIVAVQSFSGGRLIRSGSGVILTRDGLIATLNSLIPSGAYIFQVTGNGKIYKAKVVSRDYTKNIALISVAESDFQVAKLKSDLPSLGQELLIFSKLVNFGKETPLVERVTVSRIHEGDSAFEVSTPYDSQLYGSALVDGEGAILALVDFKNQKPVVLSSKFVGDFLNTYLASQR